MRDIVLTLALVVLIPLILRSPRFGSYVWAWFSMMSPQKAVFGFARAIPFAQIVAVATLIPFLFSRQRRPFPVTAVTVCYLLFFGWMSWTSLFAFNTADIVFQRWLFVFKIHLMLVVTMMLLRGRQDIERLIWVVTLSIGFYGIKGGVWTLLTGGGSRVWGPSGGMIEGNNELGLALVMLIPFMYFLHQVATRRWVKLLLVFCAAMTAVSVLGTQSRGALLALLGMSVVLSLKSRHPVGLGLLLAGVLTAAVLFMPASWSSRMHTIQTYEQDSSAMSRLYAWKTYWQLALDRPWVGGGFRADNHLVFSVYAPKEGVGDYTAGGVFVAHSIYFQALGEHGFPGLGLFLLLGILTWYRAGKLAKATRDDPELQNWVPLLMRMVQVSLAGFAVGGAFLSLVYFDLPYYIVCYVVLVDATLRERSKAIAVTTDQPQSVAGARPITASLS